MKETSLYGFFLDKHFDFPKNNIISPSFPENIIPLLYIEYFPYFLRDGNSIFGIHFRACDNFIFHKIRKVNLYKNVIWEIWKMGNIYIGR